MIAILAARTIAQDMLLRGLWALEASRAPDPEAFLTESIEGIIGSIDAAKWGLESAPAVDAMIRDTVEQDLRLFLKNVLCRFSASGS